MADDLAGLNELRGQLVNLTRLIEDSRTPSGARRRATKALAAVALQAIDLACAKLRERQAPAVEDLV
jgi:hypothetical protein